MGSSPMVLEQLVRQRTLIELLEKLIAEAEKRLDAARWILDSELELAETVREVEEMDELTANELRKFEHWLHHAMKGVDLHELSAAREAVERLRGKLLNEVDQLVAFNPRLAAGGITDA